MERSSGFALASVAMIYHRSTGTVFGRMSPVHDANGCQSLGTRLPSLPSDHHHEHYYVVISLQFMLPDPLIYILAKLNVIRMSDTSNSTIKILPIDDHMIEKYSPYSSSGRIQGHQCV